MLNDRQHRSVAAEVVSFLWFDTTIDRAVAAGDHTLVLLRLHSVAHAGDGAPLVFHRSCFRQAV
ncbi:flavin reductase family protein [Amycolatopsis carbonis]|uniref:Flavin reductase family protein n=1 Tax=Amycolatopsis carbonis TaxID=715471 RepID=A0A9Y2N0C2_9PSEU|nr:flavin reductase family protein [Amycolatopsis sp. 2-15]WIX83528.1 flavin reductase family protein [Amycolatopsis sp. 2-15]